MGDEQDKQDKNIELWKVKKLIKSLESARGYIIRCISKFLSSDSFLQERNKYDFADYTTKRPGIVCCETEGTYFRRKFV